VKIDGAGSCQRLQPRLGALEESALNLATCSPHLAVGGQCGPACRMQSRAKIIYRYRRLAGGALTGLDCHGRRCAVRSRDLVFAHEAHLLGAGLEFDRSKQTDETEQHAPASARAPPPCRPLPRATAGPRPCAYSTVYTSTADGGDPQGGPAARPRRRRIDGGAGGRRGRCSAPIVAAGDVTCARRILFGSACPLREKLVVLLRLQALRLCICKRVRDMMRIS
jgi:hypothetical protein